MTHPARVRAFLLVMSLSLMIATWSTILVLRD